MAFPKPESGLAYQRKLLEKNLIHRQSEKDMFGRCSEFWEVMLMKLMFYHKYTEILLLKQLVKCS